MDSGRLDVSVAFQDTFTLCARRTALTLLSLYR